VARGERAHKQDGIESGRGDQLNQREQAQQTVLRPYRGSEKIGKTSQTLRGFNN